MRARFLLVSPLCAAALALHVPAQESEDWMNCFAVIAGRGCTVDGSVIFAHNEDSGAGRAVSFWRVPEQVHGPNAVVDLVAGGQVPQANHSNAFLWCQMPGLKFSDSYLNDQGVAVASNGCHSREDRPDLKDGGITFMLRRIVAARAKSARHGVEIAGALVSEFGYGARGRAMTIADGKEAWLMNITNGKHWVAARVPDDKCAAIANHFTIHRVDLADKENYLASPGLIEYAQRRGWYDPKRDGAFDFATVYGTDGARKHGSNIRRAWRANSLVGDELAEGWFQPTFVKPKKKLAVADLMAILRDHNEGTKYDIAKDRPTCSPYGTGPMICAGNTSFSTIYQLRSDLPVDIGAVMWIAMGRPDATTFVPWYFGIQDTPESYKIGTRETALARHFDQGTAKHGPPPGYRAVWQLETQLDPVFGRFMPRIQDLRDRLEGSILALQPTIEKSALALYESSPRLAREYLTAYVLGQQGRADRLVRRLLGELQEIRPAAVGGSR